MSTIRGPFRRLILAIAYVHGREAEWLGSGNGNMLRLIIM